MPPTLQPESSSCNGTRHDSKLTARNSKRTSQSTRRAEDFSRLIEFTRQQIELEPKAAASDSDNVLSSLVDVSVSGLDSREAAVPSSGTESNSAKSEGEKQSITTDGQEAETCQ